MNQNNNPNVNYNHVQPTYIPSIKKTKSKFLTFILSLVPGCGQMYHGLMRRGVSIMALFFGIIALSIILYIPIITLSLPVVWFFSFFDSINRMNYSLDELKAVEDEYIFNLGLNNKVSKLFNNAHLFIGWIIVIIGVYAMFNVLFINNTFAMRNLFGEQVYYVIKDILKLSYKLIIPIICMIIGVKLIKGNSKNRKMPIQENINNQEGGTGE